MDIIIHSNQNQNYWPVYIITNFYQLCDFGLLILKAGIGTREMKITKETISGSENIFDRKQIFQKQQMLRKLYENSKNTNGIEYFAKIKFRQIIYDVGDYIILETLQPSDFYIAKLTKVIQVKVKGPQQEEVFIEIQWVMKKNDLPDNLLRLYGDYISSAEVFPSNEKVYLYVASIRCKCTILCIEEYGQISNAPDLCFYSRSNFNIDTKTIVPDPSTWNSDCFCRKPNNPDLVYIQCSKCGKWFHQDCVEKSIINGEFLCSACFGPMTGKGMQEIMKEKW